MSFRLLFWTLSSFNEESRPSLDRIEFLNWRNNTNLISFCLISKVKCWPLFSLNDLIRSWLWLLLNELQSSLSEWKFRIAAASCGEQNRKPDRSQLHCQWQGLLLCKIRTEKIFSDFFYSLSATSLLDKGYQLSTRFPWARERECLIASRSIVLFNVSHL